MNEKNLKKRFDFQQKVIARQSQQIDDLKKQIEKLTLECHKKDELISAIEPMRKEMAENIEESKRLKVQFQKLVNELKQMKKIMNVTVYKGRWRLVKWLIK